MRARNANPVGELRGRRLQPIDADRLLVTGLILKADVDIVAAFDHLLRGLGKPGLVAIDWLDLKKARQERQQGDYDQHGRRASMRGRCKVNDRWKPRRTRRLVNA